MGELLLSRKAPRLVDAPGIRHTSTAVFKGDTFISVVESSSASGVTSTGKTWKNFRDDHVTTYTWKRGPMRVYQKTRTVSANRGGRTRMGPIRDHTAYYLNLLKIGAADSILSESGASDLLLSRMEAQYPMRQYFKFAPTVTPFLTAETHVELSRRVLGKRYQKSVARALVGVSDEPLIATNALKAIILFQGIVPTDWIPRLVETSPHWRYEDFYRDRSELRGYRRILRTASEAQLRRIATRELNVLPRGIGELYRDYKYLKEWHNAELNLSDYTFTSLTDLHEQINGMRNERRRADNAVRARRQAEDAVTQREKAEATIIEYKDAALDFVGEYDGFSVVAPAHGGELMDWSDYMNNCIRSYTSEAAEGRTLLYAVEQEGKIVANMELDPKTGSVKQLLGKYNQSLDADLSAKIKQAVLQTWPDASTTGGWQ